jgi:hypothetical protein
MKLLGIINVSFSVTISDFQHSSDTGEKWEYNETVHGCL